MIVIGDMTFTAEEIRNVRIEISDLRDYALSRGHMGWALILSQAIALLGVLAEREEANET